MHKIFSLLIGLVPIAVFAQSQDIKVMSYNLMYYKDINAPCSSGITGAAKDAAFKTVFKAINPDVLAVNEVGAYPDNSAANSILTNVINTDGENNFASAKYSNNGFSSITNMLFYDSTVFSLYSQTHVAKTLAGVNLARVIDFYRLYYKDPKLKKGADTTFVTFVVGHFKASQGSANVSKREETAKAIMNYLDTAVSDENVILCGDLNLYTSTEAAYQELTNYSVASESFIDPGTPGSWNNNSIYASIHTQSTHSSPSGCFAAGGLDDRFDFIMFSKGIRDGVDHVKYKLNSLTAIGNDGAHFNSSINSGSNGVVSPTVADALYDFSDHLPVIAEFSFAQNDINLKEWQLNSNLVIANPFSENIKVVNTDPLNRVFEATVHNTNGELMYKGNWRDTDALEIPTSYWTKGLYIITLNDRAGTIVRKKLVK